MRTYKKIDVLAKKFDDAYPEELSARLQWWSKALGINRVRLLRMIGMSARQAGERKGEGSAGDSQEPGLGGERAVGRRRSSQAPLALSLRLARFGGAHPRAGRGNRTARTLPCQPPERRGQAAPVHVERRNLRSPDQPFGRRRPPSAACSAGFPFSVSSRRSSCRFLMPMRRRFPHAPHSSRRHAVLPRDGSRPVLAGRVVRRGGLFLFRRPVQSGPAEDGLRGRGSLGQHRGIRVPPGRRFTALHRRWPVEYPPAASRSAAATRVRTFPLVLYAPAPAASD